MVLNNWTANLLFIQNVPITLIIVRVLANFSPLTISYEFKPILPFVFIKATADYIYNKTTIFMITFIKGLAYEFPRIHTYTHTHNRVL